MLKTIASERIPIKLWLDDIEAEALQQARNLANLPFAFHHVAIMPDAHFGYGMPIGGVLATENMVIPNAVGVDIGCGMAAVRTSLCGIDRHSLKHVMGSIRATIPVGFKHHKRPLPHETMPVPPEPRHLSIVEEEYDRARAQIGTLGGGNHFIEIQRGSDGAIWFMIHSGSRNLGFKVAHHYNKQAAAMNKRLTSPLPSSWQLAALPLDSEEGRRYLAEMEYCVAFAAANRDVMRLRVAEALVERLGGDIEFAAPINIAHNYASRETHFGTPVIVHRKGATRAESGELGIIPGSQGTASYIVRGKGNAESFASCSHGAGRRMGRKQAQRSLNLDKEKRRLDELGIIHALRTKHDLDEASGAYKDIDTVIARQKDLIEVVEVLRPLAVIKG
ncbi:MAG: RtcB family protein [Desulfofustis sp. PB-SRB1]|jgi:tRNA-splicing ligase RtcB|nr:RtcB family protein [Desulfofustis sp. PB-SRB1]MBM1002282.1 RtcB family protein [Desulfofustis sp. PB-SRB1]HBH29579.1 RtcB family protein [Desulfofustis sp.]